MEHMMISDPASGADVEVSVLGTERLADGGEFCTVRYEAASGGEVDATFAVIDYGGNVVCQRDWQGVLAEPGSVGEFDWVDCTPSGNRDRGELP